MQVAAGGCLASQGAKLLLAPIFHRDRDRVQVGLHRAVDFRKHCAELGEHLSVLGSRRLGKGVTRRRKQLDALLYPSKQVADPRRYIDLLIAAGKAMYETVVEFFDTQLGRRIQNSRVSILSTFCSFSDPS